MCGEIGVERLDRSKLAVFAHGLGRVGMLRDIALGRRHHRFLPLFAERALPGRGEFLVNLAVAADLVRDRAEAEQHVCAELCRREGIAQSLYYTWSKEFMEAGKRRLADDTARAATTDEVKDLRREARDLKECVADLTLENRLLKKSIIADGGDDE